MKLAIVILAVVALAAPSFGRVMDRCSLAQELRNLGVAYNDISMYVCLAQYESDFNTAAVGPPNSDGSNDWGIFQINDFYWCTPPSGRYSANVCNIGCNGLITDDISPDVRCAELVKQQQGFAAWATYHYCTSPPSVDYCF